MVTPAVPQSRNDRAILAACVFIIGASLLLHLNPTGVHAAKFMGIEIPDLCPLHQISGMWCPGCGLTRSFIAAAHADIDGAFRFNPLGPILFALFALQIPYRIARLIRKNSVFWSSLGRRIDPLRGVLLIALLLSGLSRIAWGLTHMALVRAGDAPPGNWRMSILLIASAIAVRILIQFGARWMPVKRPSELARDESQTIPLVYSTHTVE